MIILKAGGGGGGEGSGGEREEEGGWGVGGRSRLPRGIRQNETEVSWACIRAVVNFASIVNSEASWIKEGAMMRKATC